jgi:hypothetical protein
MKLFGYFRRLLFKNRLSANIIDRQTVIYREGGRTTRIAGELLTDGFEIYVASIVTWDDSKGELINAPERKRILANVVASLESQGVRVVLD